MRSSSDGLARPVRTELSSCAVASIDFCMRSRASSSSSSIRAIAGKTWPSREQDNASEGSGAGASALLHGRRDERSDRFPGQYAADVVRVVDVEDMNRQAVLHAERER